MVIRNVNGDIVLGKAVRRADSFGRRLRGLMFQSGLGEGEGLLIHPCQAVHTHFMRFPIDVLFLDRDGRVLHVMAGMRPWRQSPYVKGAWGVLELAAGSAGGTVVGDQLAWE